MDNLTALILVDIQNDYFPGGKMALEGIDAAGVNAARLLSRFREKRRPVFHIRHLAVQPGATFFLTDTPGSEIHPSVAPMPGETRGGEALSEQLPGDHPAGSIEKGERRIGCRLRGHEPHVHRRHRARRLRSWLSVPGGPRRLRDARADVWPGDRSGREGPRRVHGGIVRGLRPGSVDGSVDPDDRVSAHGS